ncbi:BTE_HP_G0039330.mRNA.1.CDS.1 [Saccharomyces cerevisiae]|nr:BTE_HP_G0039330.mRNA.1.CDS.1 [Saccharomyces cerevisiae]CAI6789649.1 BTE_HP_G0039330.mRNA.1.CDS.1 [Saccharomyces cerevisiae]
MDPRIIVTTYRDLSALVSHNLPKREVNPHLIFDNFTTALGKRVVCILKHLFNAGPKKDSERVITFANRGDFISVRIYENKRIRLPGLI